MAWPLVSQVFVSGYLALVIVLMLASRRGRNTWTNVNPARLSFLGDMPAAQGCQSTQSGLKKNVVGMFWLGMWILVPLLGHLLVLIYIGVKRKWGDPFGLDDPDDYTVLLQPFLVIFFQSAAVTWLSAHWKSTLLATFMTPCSLREADLVQASIGARAQVCKVFRTESFKYINFMCYRYVFDEDAGRFRPVGEEIVTGLVAEERTEGNGLSARVARELSLRAGGNEVLIEVPGVLASLFEEFHCITCIYQTYCIYIYFFFEINKLGCLWALLVFGTGSIKALAITRSSRLKIKEMAQVTGDCFVIRDGTSQRVPCSLLAPGDLLKVDGNIATMPCDAVLVRGVVVMHEAMLTGEPMPISKSAIEKEVVRSKADNILYAGTDVMDTQDSSDNLAIVQAIGGATEKANLLRLVLFPSDPHFQFDESMPKVYCVLIIYTLIIGALMFFIPHPFRDSGDFTITCVKAVFNILQAINPMVGVAAVCAQSKSAQYLARKGISCLAPGRIPMAGCVDTVVLDKTGTITKDGLEFVGFQLFGDNGVAGKMHKRAMLSELPQEVQWFLASCHKLTPFTGPGNTATGGDLLGPHVDKEMFRALGTWMLSPTQEDRLIVDVQTGASLTVLKVFDFDHVSMTSGCICRDPHGTAHLFIKGASSAVHDVCARSSPEFISESDEWSAKGCYVLGCAMKQLGSTSNLAAPRQELVRELSPCGLLLFMNELKHDSEVAIDELIQSNTRVVICTGDNLLTGIRVAKQVGIIKATDRVMRLLKTSHGLIWEGRGMMNETACDDAVVMDQQDWDALRESDMLDSVLPHIRVLGRMKPDGKVTLVEELQNMGLCVGMCGDGGNDCGALRAAHVGLALSSAEVSIVAPFCAGQERSLFRVGDLLKEGRACLATSKACFNFYLGSGLVVTSGLKGLLTILNDSNPSEWQWLWMDFVMGLGIPYAMVHCQAAATLSPWRPASSLLSRRNIVINVGSWAIFLVSVAFALRAVCVDKNYMPWNPASLGISGDMFTMQADNFEDEIIFVCAAAHIAALGFVYSYGSYHRRPICMNLRLIILYLLLLLPLMVALALITDTSFNCLLRVNCSSEGSLKASENFFGAISKTKTKCFLGPQIHRWADQLHFQTKLSDLVNLAMHTDDCLPPESERKDIDAKWLRGKAISNILSDGTRHWMIVHFAMHFIFMNGFYYFVVLHKNFDVYEEGRGYKANHGRAQNFREELSEMELVETSSSSG